MTTALNKVREEHEQARLAHETARLQAETQALKQPAVLQEAWGDLVPQSEYPQFDFSDSWQQWGGFASRPAETIGAALGDRARGENPPFVMTEADLTAIRSVARIITSKSATAHCAMEVLTSYVIGNGYSYRPIWVAGGAVDTGLLAVVEQIIKTFLRENNWRGSREEELFRRLHRDGEIFVPVYHIGQGHAAMRILEPEQIVEPADPHAWEKRLGWDRPSSWSFGVHTDEDDTETVHGYCAHWRTPERNSSKYFPISQLIHCKRNVDGHVKRGVSDFFAVYEYLLDAAKLLRNTARGSAILAAIAMIREHAPGVTQSQIESMRSGGAWSRFNQVTRTEGTRTKYTHRYLPGTIVDVPNGQQYKPSPLAGQGVGSAMVVIEQAILRMVGSNWCMPEYMISSDASNTNYSSALVSEAPFTKFCERQQEESKQVYIAVLWAALRIAHQAGRLDGRGVSFARLQELIDIKVEVPLISARDRNVETNRRKVMHDSGILSPQTWATEEGYDWQAEQQAGAKIHAQPAAVPDMPGIPAWAHQPGNRDNMEGARYRHAAQLLWGDYP